MSYQVLARKWRPGNFEELVGQRQTAQALKNALENQRLHHAYLFTGTRGVGKTTIARILSKSLNCELGITPTPCGECASCVEISQGNFVDLIEIDAASKTKVEDTREMLDNVQYRPTRGRYKVYLIDEVHMLSGHSFNALLKTLEEPPPHVIFLLATTDPQKMPVTVLSRCLQFHLRHMEIDEITHHLQKILEAENIAFEPSALEPIAKGADGSMRDALSLLDQAIAFSGEKILKSTVLDMLGSIDRDYAFQLLQAVCSEEAQQLMAAIEKIAEYSPDYDELMADWLSLLHEIAVCQATSEIEEIKNNDSPIAQFAVKISPADLQLFYQLSLQARRDLGFAPHPRQAFEMAMLRILAFKPAALSPEPLKKKLIESAQHDNASVQTLGAQPLPSSSGQAYSTQAIHASQNCAQIEPVLLTENRINSESEPKQKLRIVVDNERKTQSQLGELGKLSELEQLNELGQPILDKSEGMVNDASKAAKQDKPPKLDAMAALKKQLNNECDGELTASSKIQFTRGETSVIENKADRVELSSQNIETEFQTVTLDTLNEENWFNVVGLMAVSGNGLQVLLNSVAKYQQQRLVIFYLEVTENLLTPLARQTIEENLKHFFEQKNLEIEFTKVENLQFESPKQRQIRLYAEAIDNALSQLQEDPQVSYLVEHLQASLDKESIKIYL